MRSGELRKHGIRLRIQDQPFRVLCMVLERPGELVTRDQLRQSLWPADTFVDFNHGLSTAVNKLREVLGDSAANPRFIETLAKRGYRYVGPAPVMVGEQSDEKPLAVGTRALASADSGAKVIDGGGLQAETAEIKAAGEEKQSSVARPFHPEAPGTPPITTDHLPLVPRSVVRTLFALAQVMYLSFYIVALAQLHLVYRLAGELVENGGRTAETAALITASVGVVVRLYLLTAVAFDYRPLGWKFKRIFPLILILDFAWALAPFLIAYAIGFGLATLACAALLYLPFSQRTLIRMAYLENR